MLLITHANLYGVQCRRLFPMPTPAARMHITIFAYEALINASYHGSFSTLTLHVARYAHGLDARYRRSIILPSDRLIMPISAGVCNTSIRLRRHTIVPTEIRRGHNS